MSRAFVSDDAPGEPPLLPPRAPLPEGVLNSVTPRGLDLLHDEREALDPERQRLVGARQTENSPEVAQPEDPKRQAPNVARFGTTVTLCGADGSTRRLQILGVDEGDAGVGRVAFTSPEARALTGARPSTTVELRSPGGTETVAAVAVTSGT